MRRALIALALTIAGLIPLLRYHPSHTTPPTQAFAPPTGSTPPWGFSPPSGSGSSATRMADGPVIDTAYGPYRVRAAFTGQHITDVQLITVPDDGRSQRIAKFAAPILRQEALQAQSANIDTVSGATITSDAYAQSLQAAIDANGG